LQPSFPRGLLEIIERGKAELLIKLHHLVRAKTGDREHFKDASGNFLPHFLKRGMRTRRIKLFDDGSDRMADARDFEQSVLRDDLANR
jgi:hypothetical protein